MYSSEEPVGSPMDPSPPPPSGLPEPHGEDIGSPQQEPQPSKEREQHNLTMFEVCEKLTKSRKTVSRYVRRGLLHPKKVRSQQGTLKYRFSEQDLEDFRRRQDRQGTRDVTGQTGQRPPIQESPLLEPTTDETRQNTKDRTGETVRLGEVLESATLKEIPKGTGQDRGDKISETEIRGKTLEHASSKENPKETGQVTADETDHFEIINLLKETTTILKEQLGTKDFQIEKLNNTVDLMVERNRELNILLKGEQDRALRLQPPARKASKKTRMITPATGASNKPEKTGQDTTEGQGPTATIQDDKPDQVRKKSWLHKLMGT